MGRAGIHKISRLLVLANRLPVHRVGRERDARWVPSAGGLVTALQPVLQRVRGCWIGWTGIGGDTPRAFRHDGVIIRPVAVSEQEVEDYYHGMANQTLWPLYHDATRTPEFRRDWWRSYLGVNQRFARAAANLARRGDVAWVHDYHLQMVPRLLRRSQPNLKIGFFLHTPFPPEELFEWLPWRSQILTGLLGADVVGFQTVGSARNFSRLAREYTSAEGTDQELAFEGRTIYVNAFPISIDTEWWEERAQRPDTLRKVQEIRKRIGPKRKILLAVDRLDYTKGIDFRLQAFEELLMSKKASSRDCVLVQIAAPSRESEKDYSQLRAKIERTVGRINGQFSAPGRVAVHYFRKNLTREDLAAYYLAADVMLVTPLRDGMNLVAKEYVATRTDNTGVLVLSQFAGAARELTRALIVNPRDIDQMTKSILQAMRMPYEEAAARMSILRMRVRRHDVYLWAEHFLQALTS